MSHATGHETRGVDSSWKKPKLTIDTTPPIHSPHFARGVHQQQEGQGVSLPILQALSRHTPRFFRLPPPPSLSSSPPRSIMFIAVARWIGGVRGDELANRGVEQAEEKGHSCHSGVLPSPLLSRCGCVAPSADPRQRGAGSGWVVSGGGQIRDVVATSKSGTCNTIILYHFLRTVVVGRRGFHRCVTVFFVGVCVEACP